MPKGWTHGDLYENFEAYGEIQSAKVSITAEFESRGYGFVEFSDAKSVAQAVAAMHNKEVESNEEKCTLQVAMFENKRQRLRQGQEPTCSTNLYVKNFPPRERTDSSDTDSSQPTDPALDFNDSDLVELFRPFGEIVSACVMKDAEGKSRGFGFVCF